MQNKTMIYGYARVSTAAQDEAGQVRQLKAAGCEKVFREKITGTTADRPKLVKLMKILAPGDIVITTAVDRLSRDTTDLLVIARDMQRAGAGKAVAERGAVLRHFDGKDAKPPAPACARRRAASVAPRASASCQRVV
jgi:DNA invertase Pin-like site-specific DNA recombinase